MAQVYVIGRVTADLVVTQTVKSTKYIRFSLAENLGYGDSSRTQYYQVWAWGDDVTRLKKVKKGRLIWVSGSLELEEYMKKDGRTRDKQLKVKLDNWGYIPSGSKEQTEATIQTTPYESIQGIDGDKENLPE